MENFRLKDMQAIASKNDENNFNCSYFNVIIRNSDFNEALQST